MGRRRSRIWVGAGVLLGGAASCGPTIEPDTGSGSTAEPSLSSGSDADPSVEGSEGAQSATGAADSGAVDSSTSTAGETGDGSGPLYSQCEGQTDCLAGLTCTVVALGDRLGSICTTQCNDPLRDCEPPPAGFVAVCGSFLHDRGPDPFCAIGCVDARCPEGMRCGTDAPFSEPYYCIPD